MLMCMWRNKKINKLYFIYKGKLKKDDKDSVRFRYHPFLISAIRTKKADPKDRLFVINESRTLRLTLR